MRSGDDISHRISLDGGQEVKKELGDIGREGERAFQQLEQASRQTRTGLAGIGDRVQVAMANFRSFRDSLGPVRDGFRELHEAGSRFGESLGSMADRVFPHFREVAALSLPAAVALFYELSKSAAEATDNIKDMSTALGLSTKNLQALRLVGAQSGMPAEKTDQALGIFFRGVGQARQEIATLTGQLPGMVTQLRGPSTALAEAGKGAQTAAADVAKSSILLQGGIHRANESVLDQSTVFLGARKAALDFSTGLKSLGINVNDFKDDQVGNVQILREAALRLDKMGESSMKASIGTQLFGRGWKDAVAAFENLDPALKSAIDLVNQYGLDVSEEEDKRSKAFLASSSVFKAVFDRTRTIVGNSLNQLWIPFYDGLTRLLGNNIIRWKEWADGIVNGALPSVKAGIDQIVSYLEGGLSQAQISTPWAATLIAAFTGISLAAQVLFGALERGFYVVSAILDPLAQLINYFTGGDISGQTLAFAAAILYLAGAFRVLGTAISLVIAIFSGNWIVVGIKLILALSAVLIAFWPEIKPYWDAALAWIGDFFSAVWDIAKPILTAIGDFIAGIVRGLAFIGDKLGSLPSGAASPAPFARGGDVRGPRGTDRVPIWATAGEFVMRLAAVRHYGIGFMRRLNSMALPAFNAGGLVPAFDMPAPRQHFAAGGIVAASAGGMPESGFTIVLDGAAFRSATDAATAQSLHRVARSQALRRTGRKPGWSN